MEQSQNWSMLKLNRTAVPKLDGKDSLGGGP
jgi:hypothetical protein